MVGGAVVRHLVEAGHRVRALYRGDRHPVDWDRWDVEPVSGDLMDVEGLQRFVQGCSVVFNVAGVNEMCVSDPSKMESVNVDGVRNVVSACRSSGVDRLVHTSSAVTIGQRKGVVGVESSSHRGHFLSEYERTKYLGERALFAESDGLDVVSVNPSSVQGPGRATGTGKIILDVVNGRMPFLIDSKISLVDIDDCAAGHLLAASEGDVGERYVLSGVTLTVGEAVGLASAAVGRPLRVRYLPIGLVSGLTAVAQPIARMLGRELPICREMVRVMGFGHVYDGTKAERELGLEYRPVEETIDRTVAWFRSEGLVSDA